MALSDLLQNTGRGIAPIHSHLKHKVFPADVWLLLCQAKIWADLPSVSMLLMTWITGILKRKARKVSPGILLAWLQFLFFKIICCKIDRAVQLFSGVFSKNSRGRIWQPCSVMDWNVRSAYGERRKKARGKAKPELFFETPLKLGWWLNKAFSPPKVQQQQQKIWSENKSLFFFGKSSHFPCTLGDCYFSQQDFSLARRNNESVKLSQKKTKPIFDVSQPNPGVAVSASQDKHCTRYREPSSRLFVPPKRHFFPWNCLIGSDRSSACK